MVWFFIFLELKYYLMVLDVGIGSIWVVIFDLEGN